VKRLPHELRTASYVQIALDIIDERGLEALTVGEVVERSSLSRQTFYANFQNIEDLLFALVDHIWSTYFGDLEPALGDRRAPEYVVTRLSRFLDMPPSIRKLVASAIVPDAHTHPSLVLIRDRVWESVETNWITTNVNSATPRRLAVAATSVLFAATLNLCALKDAGVLTDDDVLMDLATVARALDEDPRRNRPPRGGTESTEPSGATPTTARGANDPAPSGRTISRR
jgi:AcrR family transcriptional regulator